MVVTKEGENLAFGVTFFQLTLATIDAIETFRTYAAGLLNCYKT